MNKRRIFLIIIIMTLCCVVFQWSQVNASLRSLKMISQSYNMAVNLSTDSKKLFFYGQGEKVSSRCKSIAEENVQTYDGSSMNVQHPINPHSYAYLLNPCTLCANDSVHVVITTPTAPDNFKDRVKVRQRSKYFIDNVQNKARLLFFLGTTNDSDPALQSQLDAEFAEFGDIVQEDFIDSYYNLSLKSVAILRWAVLFCPKSKFFIKSDSDVSIHRSSLMEALTRQNARHSKFIIGNEGADRKPHRNETSKWYVSYEKYSHKYFPRFVMGPTYAFTTNAALDLFLASTQESLFHLEDVFVTGICAKRAGIPIVKDRAFFYSHPKK